MSKQNTVFDDLKNNCDTTVGNKAGQYRLDEASIEYGGQEHGLGLYVQKIYVFEDIDKFGITGWLEMMDSDNLISGARKHQIMGQELLKFKFRTLGSHLPVDFIKHPVHIHKIENIRQYDPGTGAQSVGTQQYRIHFCSPEMMNNDRIRVSKSYRGKRYDEMVEDILVNFLKTKKDIRIEKTVGKYDIIIPNMHPYDAINFIAKQCVNKRNVTNYNFYETTKGFRFKSLHASAFFGRQTAIQNDNQMNYTFTFDGGQGNYMREMSSAISQKFIRTGDTYTGIQDGLFSSKSIFHDSYHKTYVTKAVRYTEDLPSSKIPGAVVWHPHYIKRGSVYVSDGTEFDQQIPDFKSVGYDEFPDSRVFMDSTGTNHAYDFVGPNNTVRTKGTTKSPTQLNLRQMQQIQDRYLQLQLTVHGLSGLQVGDSIRLQIPKQGALTSGESGVSDTRWTTSGYYITKLVNRIDLQSGDPNYKCDMIVSPFKPGMQNLPENGKFAGKKDAGIGAVEYASNEIERNEEAD